MKNSVVAVLCSDLHLSSNQPSCRADDDWMEVQAGYLQQLLELANRHVVPVICAGDIFDKWNPTPEVISFALDHLPTGMICVPGQHDLPNHNMKEIHRSGYGVLVKAGKIICASLHRRRETYKTRYTNIEIGSGWSVYGFGWEEQITPPVTEGKSLAVVHKYIWDVAGNTYPGARHDTHVCSVKEALKGYDAAVFGDNHKGFIYRTTHGTRVWNNGCFIRRKSDEIIYQPSVGLLYNDGTIKKHWLDTSKDKFHTTSEQLHAQNSLEFKMIREFVAGLESLGEHGLNFKESVRNYIKNKKVDKETAQLILLAIE